MPYDIGFGSYLLNITPKAYIGKAIDKLDYLRTKNFCA